MSDSEFAAKVVQTNFDSTEEEKFRTFVHELAERTQMHAITCVDDVILDKTGRIERTGWALSPLAMQHLCSRLSSGLYTLAMDIAGFHRRRNRYDGTVSVSAAARLINTCLAVRFSMPGGLRGCVLVLDSMTNVVEGIVGPNYQYLSHIALHDTIKSAAKSVRSRLSFAGASVVGRRLSVEYTCMDPAFVLPNGDTFYPGLYFNNSESGECGVHMSESFSVVTPTHRLRALGPLKQFPHSGKRFPNRLLRLIHKVVAKQESVSNLIACANNTQARKLPVLTADKKLNKEWRIKLIKRLSHRKVDKYAAADVLRWAIFAGGRGTKIPKSVMADDLGSRTGYDLFISLLRIAQDYPPRVREFAERAGFELLSGRIKYD